MKLIKENSRTPYSGPLLYNNLSRMMTQAYTIFLSASHTGGTLLSNQEIRNCVHTGPFVEFLVKLNKDPEWRKILGKEMPDSRREDIELLLRFFGLEGNLRLPETYEGFLVRFYEEK